jgi:c-di-GMP-related signal transduction protein
MGDDGRTPPSSTCPAVARQPIFDRQKRVHAYELLFRFGFENVFACHDGDHASKAVIANAFLIGLQTLTQGRQVFINCTRDILVNDYVFLVPGKLMVVEILETIDPDEEVVAACRRLKSRGYRIALDDFTASSQLASLLALADIVKIDFRATPPAERTTMAAEGKRRGLSMVAEKVETESEFREAAACGYTYFQGYFFARPEIVATRDIPAFKLNYLRVLREVNRPEVDLSEVERIVKAEASLSYRLLRYLNSAFFSFSGRIRSLRHGLSLLGEDETRKWISLVATTAMAGDKPPELVVNCLVRARFCEQLAASLRLQGRSHELFLMGLISLMDAILGLPLAEVLAEMPVAEEIKAALLEDRGAFGPAYRLIRAYERAQWDEVTQAAQQLQLGDEDLARFYQESIAWTGQIFSVKEERAPGS